LSASRLPHAHTRSPTRRIRRIPPPPPRKKEAKRSSAEAEGDLSDSPQTASAIRRQHSATTTYALGPLGHQREGAPIPTAPTSMDQARPELRPDEDDGGN